MAPLTRDDLACQSRFAWACLAALLGMAAWFAVIGRTGPALGTVGACAGCAALIVPPRERMRRLPWRLRSLPRRLDAVPVLATLLSSPGYGLGWFYGPNPYDEIVHLVNGGLAGLVLAVWLPLDGRPGTLRGFTLNATAAGLALAVGWEAFEWLTGLIGHAVDTVTDAALTTLGATVGALAGARLWPAGRAAPLPLGARPPAVTPPGAGRPLDPMGLAGMGGGPPAHGPETPSASGL